MLFTTKYYMIHCEEHIERFENIQKNIASLNNEVCIFKGYCVKHVFINQCDKINYMKSVDPNIAMARNTLSKPGEIGCYLSHHMLIKSISEQDDKKGYSVIFEDDVLFNDNIDNEINEIICKLELLKKEWDIVFLGNLTRNRKDQVIDNIYTIDKNTCCTGTHALLINNKNSKKIYNVNCNVIHAIDWHYKINIDNNILNGLVIYPQLCHQNRNLKSNIQ